MANDGGPAFPSVLPRKLFDTGKGAVPVPRDEGMSLRDYFAAQALRLDWVADSQLNAESTAQWAYEVADAMLAEREKGHA